MSFPGDPNPYQASPGIGSGPGAPGATALPLRPTVIEFGRIFNRACDIFKTNWLMAGVVVLVMALVMGAGALAFYIPVAIVAAFEGEGIIAILAMLVAFVAFVGLIFLSSFLTIGLISYFLKFARGQDPQLNELFTGGPILLPFLGLTVLFGLMVNIGTMLCVVPGILAALYFGQAPWLMVDRKVGIFEAFELSMKITEGNKLTMFVLLIVDNLIIWAGAMCCGLPAYWAIGFVLISQAVAYLDMTGQPTLLETNPPRT